MATVVTPVHPAPPDTGSPPPLSIQRHLFTVEQYHVMIEHGVFQEDEPIELIRGEIVRKMPIGNPHAATVKRLNRLLSQRLPKDLLLSIQDPISTPDSEPEPDVAILNFRDDLYASRRPLAADVRLLIEVADTSLSYDRDIKAPLYASAGISEYWIVNLNNSTVEIHREPQSDGRYATLTTARLGETLKPLGATGVELRVDDIVTQS